MSIHIPIEDIPQALMESIEGELRHYFVPILALSEHKTNPLAGSGTLVEIAGTHHILTAAHVWNAIKDSESIGLVLTTYESSFSVPREFIVAKELWDEQTPEWGPDLALFSIPRHFVSAISAHKSFLNLPKQKAAFATDAPPKIDGGFWAVTGMVGEFSTVQSDLRTNITTADIQGRAFFSGMDQQHDRGGYDYLDTTAKLDLHGVPQTFGGVSGGGLWEVELSMKSGEITWDGRRRFRGVAFWQSAISADGRRRIRFHGPRSIFGKAWKEWALPE